MEPLSILVVDDAVDTLTVLHHCLASYGHAVTTAEGGRAGIEALHTETFDVIITDVLMPDTDGMEVIMAARQLQPMAHVIVMTGGGDYFSSKELLRLGKSLGADAQLSKPFSRSELNAALDAVPVHRADLVGAA